MIVLTDIKKYNLKNTTTKLNNNKIIFKWLQIRGEMCLKQSRRIRKGKGFMLEKMMKALCLESEKVEMKKNIVLIVKTVKNQVCKILMKMQKINQKKMSRKKQF